MVGSSTFSQVVEGENDEVDCPTDDIHDYMLESEEADSEAATEVSTTLFGTIDIRSSETLLLNGGKTNFGAKERAKRFYFFILSLTIQTLPK